MTAQLREVIYFTPEESNLRAPVVVFIHDIGLVKEQYLENWIAGVTRRGYHAVSYDHRSFGETGGNPRDTFDWRGQAEDLIDMVTNVTQLDRVDPSAVFCWGVGHSAGVVAM